MPKDIPEGLKDFRNFLFLGWEHLGLPPPTPVQYDIAHYLQHGCSPEELRKHGPVDSSRLGVEAFRGVGKSWITGLLAAHDLLLDPEYAREMVVSANAPRAKKFMSFVRRLLDEWPLLQHLAPSRDQRDSITEGFDVRGAANAQAPSVMAIGITGQMTGARATRIIPDDIEIPKNSDTVVKRELLAEAVKEFDSVLAPGGKITYLGTPQTEESIYNTQLVKRGYRFRVWPARVPTKEKAEKYGSLLAPMIKDMIARGVPPGTPVEPSRFPEEELTRRELSLGRSTFALQFQLDTSLSDAEKYPLRCSDFVLFPSRGDMAPVKLVWAGGKDNADRDLPVVGFSGDRWYHPMWTSKDFDEFQGSMMAIDPSGRGQDELAYAVVKMLNGNLYLAEARGLTGGYTKENLEKLSYAAKRHKVKHIRAEANFGDGMFTALLGPVLHRIYPTTVEEVKHNVQKERRIIDTLEPVLNQHRLIVDPAVITEDYENYNDHPEERALQYSLFYQLTHITKEKGALVHDDRLDALAMAVAYWVEVLGKDDHNARAEFKRRQQAKIVEDYFSDLGKVVSLVDNTPTWMTTRR